MEKVLIEQLVKMHRLQLEKDEKLQRVLNAEGVQFCCDEDVFLEMLGKILEFTKEETIMLADYYTDYVSQWWEGMTIDNLFDCIASIREGNDITPTVRIIK